MSRMLQLYREAGRRSIPVEVLLELTHHCNFRCQHCYIPDFDAPDLLSTERLLTLLDELAEMGTLVLGLTGGEVLLRRDWAKVAARARELRFALNVFTNGWGVGDEQADTLAALDARVHVSFYSASEDAFDTITQRPGSFRRVRAGLDRLRARGVNVVLKVPLMTLNDGGSAAVQEYARSIGADCRVSPTIYAKKDGDRSTLRLRLPHERLAETFGGPLLGCHPAEAKEDGPLCAAASRYCNITPTGDVMACSVLPGSDSNIRHRAFRDVWENSPWLQKIRGIRARDLRTCNECPRLSYCGRCHAQALAEDGDLYGPSSHAQRRADLIDAARAQEAGCS